MTEDSQGNKVVVCDNGTGVSCVCNLQNIVSFIAQRCRDLPLMRSPDLISACSWTYAKFSESF